MKVIYRRVDLKNAEEMQHIAAIDMGIPALFDPLFEVNPKTISERLEQLMKCKETDFFEVALFDGKIVGYHFMNQFKTPHGLMAADIQTLWVAPEFRQKGIATELKKRGETWAKKMKLNHISTFVHAKNKGMLALNENLDFELVGYKLRKNLK